MAQSEVTATDLTEAPAESGAPASVDLGVSLEDTFPRELPELVVAWQASPVPEPAMIAFNRDLARSLGFEAEVVDTLDGDRGAAVFSGNVPARGPKPMAMAYAGHQFGGYSPRLGDGRALLLGEVVDPTGRRFDLHLKGSGRTPFARGGDGKAELAPMLREYLIAEAMAALGVPTSRALAVVETGEQVHRRGLVPGGVLTRVAASHIRVGTFEYAVRLPDRSVFRRLADYTIARHYPDVAVTDEPYLRFLERVVDSQAALVARWMLIGFIHGVMNTDNMAISGETIDYGPCAFMDGYDQRTVYSSIDHQGRYAFGNQPTMAHWNLSRLAETLLPLMVGNETALAEDASEADKEQLNVAIGAATEVLDSFADRFRDHWTRGMAAKLGLTPPAAGGGSSDERPPKPDPDDAALFGAFVELLQEAGVDHTSTFRALAHYLRGDEEDLWALFDGGGAARDRIEGWLGRWTTRLDHDGRARPEVADTMDGVNPLYIPRNHLVEEALNTATVGDLQPFLRLLEVVTDPYRRRPGIDPVDDTYAQPAPNGFYAGYQTFCGT
jgi:uncharacterized protein YdiU (UPF0061 family)